MKFYSTNKKSEQVSFKEAVIKSLPADNGLYFPVEIPELDFLLLSTIDHYSLPDIGLEVMRHFCSEDIPSVKLEAIIKEVLDFDMPIVEVEKNIHSLELTHGPTYAFKDVGARFLARCLGYFNESENKEITILVATSGDTGGAVAAGFHNVPGVKVVILYPSGKVSPLQEKQLTTLGGNITALEVSGDFDDCQAMVKKAFLDADINAKLNLSSANSINVARWMPQCMYYFAPFIQFGDTDKLVFSVPSGNYGNITSGMLAKKMGLPIKRFIAASNANDVVPRYLKSGKYEPKPTIATISNAMDVNSPSNHPRMLALHDEEFKSIKKDVSGYTLSDEATKATMKHCYAENNYILDPHGAIAYSALKNDLQKKEIGLFLETAHYSKFLPTVNDALDKEIDMPAFAADLMAKEKVATAIENNFEAFKTWLLD
ncbi:MAG: threonine synthase [Cyclobacteriaceae bacterium]